MAHPQTPRRSARVAARGDFRLAEQGPQAIELFVATEVYDNASAAARESLGVGKDGVGEGDSLLIDEAFFEHEGHGRTP